MWRLHPKRAPCSPRTRCVARMALCQGGLWLALPHPQPSVKKSESVARHFLRLGPPSSDGKIRPAGTRWHIWHRLMRPNRILGTPVSVDYHDACMAQGSQRDDLSPGSTLRHQILTPPPTPLTLRHPCQLALARHSDTSGRQCQAIFTLPMRTQCQ